MLRRAPSRQHTHGPQRILCAATQHESQKGLSPMKVRVYEYLHLLNQSFQQGLRILQRLEKCPGLRRDFLRSFQVMIEEIRAEANQELTEIMCERELKDWARFGRKRRKWEKRFQDPDDVYIEVERQEQERRRKGLPPRTGILPAAEPPEAPNRKKLK